MKGMVIRKSVLLIWAMGSDRTGISMEARCKAPKLRGNTSPSNRELCVAVGETYTHNVSGFPDFWFILDRATGVVCEMIRRNQANSLIG